MSDFKYKVPETYEEAVKRKNELLNMINAYNEALFAEKELPYTDEEMENMQEEYQILNDHLALTEEEKISKLDDDDVVINEDGTKAVKVTFFDRIHWCTYLYVLLGTLLVVLFGALFVNSFGTDSMTKYINNYFDQVYGITGSSYSIYSDPDTYGIADGAYWWHFVTSYFVIPLITLVVTSIAFIFTRKMDSLNKKITLITYLVHVVIIVAACLIILFTKALPTWTSYKDQLGIQYYYYVYQTYGTYY